MAINYNDSRFTDVTKQKKTALNEVNSMYNNMISGSDKFYQDQINATQQYADTQTNLQQQQTDLAVEQINQQKDYQKQDYTKEQKASYVDYQKQSNTYGANAEAMASRGLTGTGYAESSLVGMYNAYQNRVATARETYNRAIVEYDNQIKEAKLQNDSTLAEIAYNALQKKLELSLNGFQYKNTLLQQQLASKNEVEDRYYSRWQDVVGQINTENSLAEQKRQFNEQMALNKQQLDLQKQQFAYQKAQASKSSSSSKKSSKSSGSASIKKGSSNSSKSSISKSDGMSSRAKQLYSAVNTTAKATSKIPLVGNSVAKSIKNLATQKISQEYQSGNISENDVRSLVNKLGL